MVRIRVLKKVLMLFLDSDLEKFVHFSLPSPQLMIQNLSYNFVTLSQNLLFVTSHDAHPLLSH